MISIVKKFLAELNTMTVEKNVEVNATDDAINFLVKKGFNEIVNGEKVCVISSGYLLHKILDIYQSKPQINFGIIDFYQHNPINKKELNKVLDKYGKIIIVDEQTEKINTSTIIKNISSADNSSKIKSFNLKDRFIFENGGRDYLLEKNGISFKNIASELNI